MVVRGWSAVHHLDRDGRADGLAAPSMRPFTSVNMPFKSLKSISHLVGCWWIVDGGSGLVGRPPSRPRRSCRWARRAVHASLHFGEHAFQIIEIHISPGWLLVDRG